MCGWWECEDVCGGGYVNVSGGSVRTTVCGVKVCGVRYVSMPGGSVRVCVCDM